MRKANTKYTSTSIKPKLLVSVTAVALLLGMSSGMSTEVEVLATELEAADEEEILDESLSGLEQYQVKFINYDGSELYNESLPVGAFVEAPEVPERIGFTFLGWAPEVDATVTNQDLVYTAQFVETDGGYAEEDVVEDVVVYDNDSNNSQEDMFTSNNGEFTNFVFMVILFLMETVWLHDRRSQQMRRYDSVMNMLDKE